MKNLLSYILVAVIAAGSGLAVGLVMNSQDECWRNMRLAPVEAGTC